MSRIVCIAIDTILASGTTHRNRLNRGVTVLAALASVAAFPALADNAAADASGPAAASTAPTEAELGEVIVTGTRIRGVAPVGSALISMDPVAMQEQGLANTNDILNTSPAIVELGVGPHTTGGVAIQNGFSNVNSPNIHGLGTQATLSLTNGHRNWEQGVVGDVFDPNSIPAHMLARIEIVPDGTSPIYGADAIAGTVNYVLRKPEDVVETYLSDTAMHGTNTWYATGILGHTWNLFGSQSGGIIVGYQHTHTDALPASAYPSLYSNNFSPYGGSPWSDFAAPGNILVGATGYAVPAGQNGQSLTLSQLGAAGAVNRESIWAGSPGPDVFPQDTGNNVVANYFQNITDSIQFFGDSMYEYHRTSGYTVSSSNDVAAKVPNSNPFSPCNPSHYAGGVVTGPAALVAACATGSLTVHYNDVSNVGPGVGWGNIKGWETSNGFHIKLPGDWQITPQATLNQSDYYTARVNIGAPNPNTFNYFCDPSVAGCAQPGAVPVTQPAYQGTSLATPTWGAGRFYQIQADGPLFTLPGGPVRLAAGIEDDYWSMERIGAGHINPDKWDRAGYAELYIPIVGAGNAVPGIRSLELDIAGRLDDYTDTGRTTNPKFGINWTPFPGLKFHSSYGTSFRGPPIQTEADNSPLSWISSVIPNTAISSALCPQCTNPALYGINGASKLVYQESVGVNPHLAPEKSKSFSAGLDWAPESIPGLQAGINWWWIKYTGQVATPEFNAGVAGAINAQVFNDHIVYNPTFFPQLAQNNPYSYYTPTPTANLNDPNCLAVVGKRLTTQALYNSFLACSNDNTGGQIISGTTSSNPNDVIAYTYFGNVNAGSTLASGFDMNAGYSWQNNWGNWKTLFTGEYIPRYDVAVIEGAPVVNESGRFGYVLKFKGRLQLNWQRDFGFGSLSPSLFINYNSAYKQDLQYLPAGVAQSYADIASHTTLDVAIVYNTGTAVNSWFGRNLTVTLSSQNVFDQRPPRLLNSTIQFDPGYGWPPARVLQLQIGKSW